MPSQTLNGPMDHKVITAEITVQGTFQILYNIISLGAP